MTRVGIVGASGYTGLELVRLLTGHPDVNLAFITSTSYINRRLSEVYPNMTRVSDLIFSGYNPEQTADVDVVFVALPHGRSMAVVAELFPLDVKIIDLSGDCRLPADLYQQWYKQEHVAPRLLEEAVYGLTEFNRAKIADAKLVSNPGCYPTGVVLATAPLIAEKLIEPSLTANCLSGVSGAGRLAGEAAHYCQIDENVSVYKVGGVHQHIPEMELTLEKITGKAAKVTFTPHLAPFSRGIFSTICAPIKSGVDVDNLISALAEYYQNEPFVHILPKGQFPQIKSVAGSNFCHIGAAVDERTGQAIIISAIDNLGKGAAGQAVQNMNVMMGLEETRGLLGAGLYP